MLDKDVTSLRNREWLSTRLLDFLIQQAAPAPEVSNECLLGSLSVDTYLHHSNGLLNNENAHPRQSQRVRTTLESFHHNNSRRPIIPILEHGYHFMSLLLNFQEAGLWFVMIRCSTAMIHSDILGDLVCDLEDTSKSFSRNWTFTSWTLSFTTRIKYLFTQHWNFVPWCYSLWHVVLSRLMALNVAFLLSV